MIKKSANLLRAAAALTAVCCWVPSARAVDADAARALAKNNNCLKCHAVDKEKAAPSYASIAAKYTDKPDAREYVIGRLTVTGNTVTLSDGHDEEHRTVKTSPPGDAAQIRNLAEWILSR